MEFDGGSFRDPAGRVIIHDGRVFRAVFAAGEDQYTTASKAGIIDEMVDAGWLLAAYPVFPQELNELLPGVKAWLEHPALSFVSYPYEWCFSALKAAALHHLDFHLTLLAREFTLSDASAYNIQFRGTKPVFIDHLSIIRYVEGSAWIGQRQFGMQFLNPLYLWSKKRVSPLSWYRGSLEGIEPEELLKLLGLRDRLSFTVLAHIVGAGVVARRRIGQGLHAKPPRQARLTKHRFVALLTSLRDYIADLQPPYDRTVWDDYAENNSYNRASQDAKHQFVSEVVQQYSPAQVFDIGCNSGDYTKTALESGARNVVAFDFDLGALERAFTRFDKSEAPVLPLWLNAVNPSPAQGWASDERKSLQTRAHPQLVMALALIHHLCIAKNVPLDMAVDWLMSLAPSGIIEFPSKSDPMVQLLLRNRPDIFADYTEEAFLHSVGTRASIVRKEHLGDAGRLIVAYQR